MTQDLLKRAQGLVSEIRNLKDAERFQEIVLEHWQCFEAKPCDLCATALSQDEGGGSREFTFK